MGITIPKKYFVLQKLEGELGIMIIEKLKDYPDLDLFDLTVILSKISNGYLSTINKDRLKEEE